MNKVLENIYAICSIVIRKSILTIAVTVFCLILRSNSYPARVNQPRFTNSEEIKNKFNQGAFSLASQGFVENKGQLTDFDGKLHPEVKFYYDVGGLQIFLTESGIAYQFTRKHYPSGYDSVMKDRSAENWPEKMEAMSKIVRTETFRMNMNLKGANKCSRTTTKGESADHINFYNHNVLKVHSYETITYHNVYPGIDWIIYIRNGKVKYDFKVKPGADPNNIKMEFSDQEKLNLNKDGSFTLKCLLGEIAEQRPISYQGTKKVETAFIRSGNVISFVTGVYDRNKPIYVDPAIIWATYYGSTGDDYGRTCSTDLNGNVYLCGRTSSTINFAAAGHQTVYGGANSDAFLVKFNSAGSRLWSTYYGGSADDWGWDCASDLNGNIYLCGATNSTANIGFLGFQNNFASHSAFLVKFSPSGTRLWGTYYGGSGSSDGWACAVDNSGDVYLAGQVSGSASSTLASGGHQNVTGGGPSDGFLAKFNPSGARIWATFYGGSAFEDAQGCTTDALSNVYITGRTNSTLSIASGGFQNSYSGGTYDAYAVKFNSAGVRIWATYYGGTSMDNGSSVVIDASGNVFMSGETQSSTNIGSNGFQNSFAGQQDAFLVKFNSTGGRVWGTYYGDAQTEYGYSTAVDVNNNVYLCGATNSSVNIASGGFQNIWGGGTFAMDALLVKFGPNGSRLWSSYYGGLHDDWSHGVACGNAGEVYISGVASSSTMAFGGFQNSFGGGNYDGFLAKICDGPTQPSAIVGSTAVCTGVPLSYSINPVPGATSYSWSVPSNWTGTATANSINVFVSASGNLSVVATNTCGSSSTQTLGVIVLPSPTITVNSGTVCNGNSFTINPTGASVYTISGGSALVNPSVNSSYSVTGTSSAGCISSNTAISTVAVFQLPVINAPGISVCAGKTGTLSSSGAATYTWMPGNLVGNSVTISPVATSIYSVTGTSSLGCSSGTTMTVTSLPVPTLSFQTFSITCASLGTATVFPTGGIGPFSYTWSPTAQTFSIANNLNPNIYTLTTNDLGTGCITTGTTQFTSLIPLTGNLFNTPSITCNGASTGTAIVTNLAGGSPTQNYFWSNGTSTSSVPNPNNLSAGSWSVTVTDALTACQIYSVFTITQPPAFTLNITPSTPTACVGSSIVLTGTNSGGTAGYTYTWTAGPPANTLSIAQPTGGTYVYTLNSTDANNCVVSKTIAISFVNNPVLTVADVSICPLQTGTLSVTGASSYTWNASTSFSTSASSFTASPVGTQQYAVVGSALGCTSIATASVIVKPIPSPNIASNSPICNGQTLLLSASGGTSYLWTGPLTFTSTLQNPNIGLAAPNQSGLYNLTVTAANSCTAAASTSVLVNPTPTITMSGGPVCLNSALILTSNSFSGSVYFWSGPNSFTSSLQNPTINAVSFSAAGSYSLLVTSASSCTNTSSWSVTVNPVPAINLSSTSSVICAGKSSTLSVSGGLTYLWNTGSTATVIVVSPTVTTSYSVVGTSALSCTGSAVRNMSVNVLPTVSVVVSPSVYCAGKSATLSANGANTFTWSTNAMGPSIVASPLFTSFYNVRGTNAVTGCSNTAFATVSVNPLPSITASTTKSIICTGTAATITAGGANTYTWLPGNSSASMITPSPLVNTTYTLRGTISASGCSNTAVRTISVNTTPTVSVVSNTTAICIGKWAVISASGASTYTLNPGNLTGNNFTVSPTATTQFSLVGTNSVNCVNLLPSNINITVHNLKAIQGVVTSTTGQNNGNVVLYGYKPILGKWDSLNTSLVILNNYNFPAVPSGSYVVKSFPFPTDLVETYGLSASSWKGASVINHNCLVNSTQNINIITFNNLIKSKATLSGKITQGAGYANPGSPGAAIPNITVKAGIYPGPRIYQTTKTNAAGQYTLVNLTPNLSGENYYILVDIPALDTNKTYHRIIITGFENFTNLDFVVDSQRIHPLNLKVGVKELSMLNSNIKVYPNPASDQISIELELNKTEEVSLELFDLSGRKVKTLIPLMHQEKGLITVLAKVEELNEGVYLLKIKIGYEEGILKLSIVR